jgi:isoquinoline 1-oxidoreductase beta subunit
MNAESGRTAAAALSRRDFLKVSAVAGVGMAVAVWLPGFQSVRAMRAAGASPGPEPAGTFEPSIYLTIDRTGTVTVHAFRSELGQGIRTAIAMILAEELDADWSAVHVEQVPADATYGNQVTGGSVSVSGSYLFLRTAGATGRQLLVAAAAQRWKVGEESCRTEPGWVIHPDGSQRLAYGELAEAAGQLATSKQPQVKLKDPKEFRIIGTPVPLYDAPTMVNGSTIFACDVRLPNMLYATVARCPVFGGKVAGFDASKAKAVAGVRDVIQIDRGLAVVAESTWAALQGRAALQVAWDEGSLAGWSSAGALQETIDAAAERRQSMTPDPNRRTAAYTIPYLAHATMEPMACVADVHPDRCEVWAPTQDPMQAKSRAVSISGLRADTVTLHVLIAGGAFGRRHVPDYVEEAVQISKAAGVPIQLMWTREDDLQHDRYHPLNFLYAMAQLDKDGQPSKLPMVAASPMSSPVPTGYWRSVENFPDAFARESFLDELAAEIGMDPYQLRLRLAPQLALYPEDAQGVIDLAAAKTGWGTPLPKGWGRGMAYWATFGVTHVADVAEISVAVDGTVHVHRVVCAVNCGMVVNPDTVQAQMEGGIVFGLTAALKAAISVEKGRVQQSNFHDYPLLRIDEMPAIEVYIVPSQKPPTGIGEMGVPPIAPAVANAIFAATGKRIRHLPIRPEDVRSS